MAVKKKNFDVEVPLIDTIVQVPSMSLENLNGKTINLDLTRILKGKSLEASFLINVSDKAVAVPKKISLMPFYIRRMFRKGISYVESSLVYETKDRKVRIKTFMITRKKVHRSVRKAIREKAVKELADFCKDKTLGEIFSAVVAGAMQKDLSLKLKKIYPLSLCEIRAVIPVK